jgi:hypothetical protein
MPLGTGFPFRCLLWLAWLQWRYSKPSSIRGWTASINYVFSLHNFRTNQTQINISNSSRYSDLIRCCGNVFGYSLLSKGYPSTVDSITSETCLPSRCLAVEVSAVLLWLHTSGVQAPCHTTIQISGSLLTILWHRAGSFYALTLIDVTLLIRYHELLVRETYIHLRDTIYDWPCVCALCRNMDRSW